MGVRDLPPLNIAHHPRPRPQKRVPLSRLVKGAFFMLGLPDNAFCSIDVTSRCNLRCRHCYFLEQGYGHELRPDQWIALLDSLKRTIWPRPYIAYQCSWVGGEPLLRREIIERGRRFFPYNIVVTNGTLELPSWPDVHFFISVDGTEEAHEAVRGAGTYAKIKQHADRPDLDVMVTYCINRENAHCIEEFMAEWDATSVRHVAFEFHTPISGLAADDQLCLSPEERDLIIDRLLALKKIYGTFILPPARTYRLMYSQYAQGVTDQCLFREKALVFGPDGRRKRPCMLGPKADCSRCGCIIPFVTQAQVDRGAIIRDTWDSVVTRISAKRPPINK